MLVVGWALVAWMAWSIGSPPDFLPIGHRPVVHELVIQDDPLFARYRIVAGPMHGFHVLEGVRPGVPFEFSSKYGTKLYALPLGAPMPTDAPHLEGFPADWPEQSLTGAIPRGEVRSVPIHSGVYRVLTTLRIEGHTATMFELAVEREERWDRNGQLIGWGSSLVLLGFTLAGLIGIVYLARKAPRSEAAA